jgi:hypothetical protein
VGLNTQLFLASVFVDMQYSNNNNMIEINNYDVHFTLHGIKTGIVPKRFVSMLFFQIEKILIDIAALVCRLIDT